MKKYVSCLILVGILASLIVSCAERPQVRTLQAGRELEEQGKYPEALKHYQQMPQPDFREVCIGNLRYLYGDILDAMIAQQENQNSAEALYTLGKAYYQKATSLPQGQEIAHNFWFDTQTYFADQREQLHTNALAALEPATQLRADYADALLLKGTVYEETERTEQAIATYQQLVALPLTSSEAYYRLGLLLYKNGQPAEGKRVAKQAVIKEPENPTVHFTLGLLYAEEEQDGLAIAEFQQTLCYDPHYVDAYDKLAQLYLRQSNLVDAERVLRLGSQNNPDALKLGLSYGTIRSILNSKAENDLINIFQQLTVEVPGVQSTADVNLFIVEASPVVQIRYLRFRLNTVERQRPYLLPCAEGEEHPYFKGQITMLQKKIEQLEQGSQAEE